MGKRVFGIAGATLAISLVAGGVPAAAGSSTRTERAIAAARYIVVQQNDDGTWPQSFSPLGTTADGVLALVAARRGSAQIEKALDHLEASVAEADNVGLKAKLIMAAVAGGRDPRNFGGQDLVQQILDSRNSNGQYGTQTPDSNDSEVYNHALAILGLVAAGEGLLPSSAFNWLLDAQCDDGGWQSNDPAAETDDAHCQSTDPEAQDFYLSDTNTTSIAVQALQAVSDARRPREDPFRFFRKMRDPEKRGWGFDMNTRLTSADSTALVIQAHVAAQKSLPRGAMRALKRLQLPRCGSTSGAFAFTWERSEAGTFRRGEPNVPATISAVLGLLKRPLPIAHAEVTKGAPRPRSCS